MRGAVAATLTAFWMVASPASANDAYFEAAQTVISGQLNAFQSGDGSTAYSFAAPNIKRIFPTEQAFMRMVQSAYPQVNSPRSYSFGRAQMTGPGTLAQQVLITGPDGKEYEAVYTLALQDDGTFRITGVHLRAATTIGV